MIFSYKKIISLLAASTAVAAQTMTGTDSQPKDNSNELDISLLIYLPLAAGAVGCALAKCVIDYRNRRHAQMVAAQQDVKSQELKSASNEENHQVRFHS